jgi:hypothetical protein
VCLAHKIRSDGWVSPTLHTTCDATQITIPRCLGPSHPDTNGNAKCTVYGRMTIRPYKPRDSARSALLTAVRYRRSGLALHPLIVSDLILAHLYRVDISRSYAAGASLADGTPTGALIDR